MVFLKATIAEAMLALVLMDHVLRVRGQVGSFWNKIKYKKIIKTES